MKRLTQIIAGTLLVGGLVIGGLSCGESKKQQVEKENKRIQVYESILQVFEKEEEISNKKKSGQVLDKCIDDMAQIREFQRGYVDSEESYLSFIRAINIYNDEHTQPSNMSAFQNSELRATAVYIRNAVEYMSTLEERRREPLEKYKITDSGFESDIETLQKDPNKMPGWVMKKIQQYKDFFSAVKSALGADIEFLDSVIQYADARDDSESVYVKKVAMAAKKRRTAVQGGASDFLETLREDTRLMKEYFPKEESF